MKQTIQKLSRKYYPQIKIHREHLHKHPELSFEEHKTSQYIKDVLHKINIPVTDNLGGGTGLTAEIGEGEGIIALRADIDALPITESEDRSYRSLNDGVMHACGHDVHTSCLLGAAYILKELESELPCKVRLIFQPGEEKLPGGASLMIKDGVLDDVVRIIGQHVHPELMVGEIGYGSGYFMASCDELYITVVGKGGHAAMPDKIIDPIMISADLIQSLQSIVSRRCQPHTPSVLSIGKIHSNGGATNVVPQEVLLEGTFRTYDEKWREEAHRLISSMTKSICLAHGGSAHTNIVKGYPALFNNPELTSTIKSGISSYLSLESAVELTPRMTAEDFSYYSHEIPACFYRLGTASLDGKNRSAVHTSTFDIDPLALEIGAGLMAFLVFQ